MMQTTLYYAFINSNNNYSGYKAESSCSNVRGLTNLDKVGKGYKKLSLWASELWSPWSHTCSPVLCHFGLCGTSQTFRHEHVAFALSATLLSELPWREYFARACPWLFTADLYHYTTCMLSRVKIFFPRVLRHSALRLLLYRFYFVCNMED